MYAQILLSGLTIKVTCALIEAAVFRSAVTRSN
jgi:hypothetical protein